MHAWDIPLGAHPTPTVLHCGDAADGYRIRTRSAEALLDALTERNAYLLTAHGV
jgi:hypothetical protein